MTVGIGIIGTGFARKVQIPAFLACEKAEIVSVASASLENAKATAEEFGIEHFTADWRETVARPDIDLVCITTPPLFHRDMTLAAIDNGKHVLCEKPMAMNTAEAREMTEAAEKAGVLALIDHELRLLPGRLHAHRLLREKAIGTIRHVKCHFQAPHRGDPNLVWNWWSDESQGGGALGAIGSHVIDSFNWFLGSRISSVYCQLHRHVKQRPAAFGEMRPVSSDDETLMILRFADGDVTSDATGIVSISMTEYPEYRHRVEFYGADGSLAIDARGEVFIADGVADTTWKEIGVDYGDPIPGVPDTGFSGGFTEFAPQIVDALLNGRREIMNAATFEDGLEVQRVLDAARESDKTGRAVTVA